jgi:hypothetical protein
MASLQLSSVVALSSIHGRERRAERWIDKKDLQAARLYGTCEISPNARGHTNLKFRYKDIIYITDETGTRDNFLCTAWKWD